MNVLGVKLVDRYLGSALCALFGIFRSDVKFTSPRKILVVQLWGIGESVLTLPAVLALRSKFPSASIDVLCTSRNEAVYYGQNVSVQSISGSFGSVLSFILGHRSSYDLVIDMEEYLNVSALVSFFVGGFCVGYSHGQRSRLYHRTVVYNDKQHASLTFFDLVMSVGVQKRAIDSLPALRYLASDVQIVEKVLKEKKLTKKRIVCLALGAAESAKSRIWPLDRYTALCNKILHEHDVMLVFTGTSSEQALIDYVMKNIEQKERAISLVGKFNLPQLFCFMERCTLFIGNDSGPMHIAAAQGVDTIGLFGPNLPLRFGPLGNVGLYKGMICPYSPCINVHKGQVPDCLFAKHSEKYQMCMKNISVDDVLVEVRRLLE